MSDSLVSLPPSLAIASSTSHINFAHVNSFLRISLGMLHTARVVVLFLLLQAFKLSIIETFVSYITYKYVSGLLVFFLMVFSQRQIFISVEWNMFSYFLHNFWLQTHAYFFKKFYCTMLKNKQPPKKALNILLVLIFLFFFYFIFHLEFCCQVEKGEDSKLISFL